LASKVIDAGIFDLGDAEHKIAGGKSERKEEVSKDISTKVLPGDTEDIEQINKKTAETVESPENNKDREIDNLFSSVKGPEELYEVLRQEDEIEFNNKKFKAEDLIEKARLVLEEGKTTSWATRNIKPLGDLLKKIKKSYGERLKGQSVDEENGVVDEDFETYLNNQNADLEEYDDKEVVNLETHNQEEESVKQELLKLSSLEKKKFFEGVANLGYRSNELKSKFFKKLYSTLASQLRNGRVLNNYFNNFSDIYGKLENSSRKKREEVGKDKLSRGIGVGQGIGNVLKYGRILIGNGFSNPARYITAISMFVSRASEAGKEARFDSLQQKKEKRDDIEKLNDEEKEKVYKILSDKAYSEAFNIYDSLKEKNGKEKLSYQDLEDYYIAEVPESLKNRLDQLSKQDDAGVKWLAKILNKQSSKYVERIQGQIKEVELSSITEDEKDIKVKKILRKNNKKLKEIDRMLSDQGVIDSMAYTARIAEKSGKTIANLLMLDTGYRIFKVGFDYFSDSDLMDDVSKNVTRFFSEDNNGEFHSKELIAPIPERPGQVNVSLDKETKTPIDRPDEEMPTPDSSEQAEDSLDKENKTPK
jgi:hypothetical protein